MCGVVLYRGVRRLWANVEAGVTPVTAIDGTGLLCHLMSTGVTVPFTCNE
jgi:hypothetical protein